MQSRDAGSQNTDLHAQHLSAADLEIANNRGDAVVTGISLDVVPGQFVGVVGETGSGKSVVLKAMLALLPEGLYVRHGQLWLDGENIRIGDKRHEGLLGHRLGFVPQDPLSSLNPVRTVYSQAKELVKKDRRTTHEQISEAMIKAGLDEPDSVIFKYPHELSGGLRQRVLIGLSLIQSPEYIFCDEGTTALDVIVQQAVMRTLRHAVDSLGVGLVFVSHDIALIGAFADQMVVMYGGRTVETGPARGVLLRPKHPYTKALLDAEPKMVVGHIPEPIPGNVPPPGRRPPGCIYSTRCRNRQSKCDVEDPPMTHDGDRHYACWFPV